MNPFMIAFESRVIYKATFLASNRLEFILNLCYFYLLISFILVVTFKLIFFLLVIN